MWVGDRFIYATVYFIFFFKNTLSKELVPDEYSNTVNTKRKTTYLQV
jgi:hypothetical protein